MDSAQPGLFGADVGSRKNSCEVFFLSCVLVADVRGVTTASRKILLIQAPWPGTGAFGVKCGRTKTDRHILFPKRDHARF
jgi:hypothetical protein